MASLQFQYVVRRHGQDPPPWAIRFTTTPSSNRIQVAEIGSGPVAEQNQSGENGTDLRPGDWITEVNGQTRIPAIREEFRSAVVLHMSILRERIGLLVEEPN